MSQMTRRLAVLGALLLPACTGTASGGDQTGPKPAVVRQPGWTAWVAAFHERAQRAGIQTDVLDASFADAGFVPEAIERDRSQAEFRRSLEDYLALVAGEPRVAEGRRAAQRQADTLARIEARWGVPGPIVAAIWGIESRYGTRRGTFPVISATSTLAYDGRRGAFFEAQLLDALRIVQAGDVRPERMLGSWAGAMGHTQFIPSSFRAYAVDFTGDGRRDVWGDDPTDALASTANYLARSGWRRGEPWGGEVGTSAAGGRILRPDVGGPAFGVRRNFEVIKRYNDSDLYALAVGYLADRISGGGPLRSGFGPDRFGLTRMDRQRVQQELARRGYDVGDADGVIGSRTIAAIRAFQASVGVPVTGDATPELLRILR